jgi:UDP-N-acetylmuramoyl-tripeptide--D-alanyl-D-alanine ligase
MATEIPQNRARFSLSEIALETGGVVLSSGALTSAEPAIGVSTDTRALPAGAVFVALRGTSFDGHDHLGAAFAAGALAAVVERDVTAPAGLGLVRVDSTVTALGALARAHARRWRGAGGARTIVAITGSAGKTTTRVALTALLAGQYPGAVHAASGNLNNLIGVPMILLGLLPEHRMAVLELGTNERGEIAALASMAEPDLAIMTLIAPAHCEGLGSMDDVAAEKGALFQSLSEAGCAVGNGDDARVQRELDRARPRRRTTYGFSEGTDYHITSREIDGMTRARIRIERRAPGSNGKRRDPCSIEFHTPLIGEAGALACAAALAATEEIARAPIDGTCATQWFASADVGAGAGRLVPRMLAGDLALIDDSYNANPASSCASIRTATEIAQATGRRLVLVLGEMRELGSETARGHEEVAQAASRSGAAEIIAVAGEARRIAGRAGEAGIHAVFVDNAALAAEAALSIVRPGDLLLIKGSRGVATERVVRALVDAAGRGAAPAPRGSPEAGVGP